MGLGKKNWRQAVKLLNVIEQLRVTLKRSKRHSTDAELKCKTIAKDFEKDKDTRAEVERDNRGAVAVRETKNDIETQTYNDMDDIRHRTDGQKGVDRQKAGRDRQRHKNKRRQTARGRLRRRTLSPNSGWVLRPVPTAVP